MNVQISSDAERDIIQGIEFYSNNGVEVGDYFRDSLMSDLRALEIIGGVHAKRFGYHCMAAKRFPFAIYYTIHDSTVMVVAILDERRNPQWVANRLKRG
ncbi:MAG: hypothetical protein KDA88_13305 [Planctomycetaceae bacterium]|nr:hypothetical protein [Planctomycetaceae bacterium]MCB9954004.1 type II toxin-antitoxin system RelE/ParE family toxin [Planctomycetaceae bacterium]